MAQKKRKQRGRPPGTEAHYKQLAEQLTQSMDSGDWPVGKAIPSCRQLAQTHGASLKTIQLALNVLKTEGRLCTSQGRPSIATLGASSSHILKNTVAIVYAHSFESIVPHSVHGGILQRLKHTGWTTLTLQGYRWRNEFPIGLSALPLRGVLLLGPFSNEMLHRYESLRLPVVLLDQPGAGFELNAVTADNFNCMYDATMRVLALGHRRVAFVRSLVASIKGLNPNSLEREKGFTAACKKSALSPSHYRVFSAWEGSTSTVADALVRTLPRFTAVLTASPVHAVQVEHAALGMGLRIPADLSIVTLQGLHSDKSDWSGPQIDFEKIGELGVKLLERQVSGFRQIALPATWHAGDSLDFPESAATTSTTASS
jgi:DNA-binding LacI/PurR family transcriptional regulator